MESKLMFTIIVFFSIGKFAMSQTELPNVCVDENENDIAIDMNYYRQFTEPPATRITCLDWDKKLKNDISEMPSCEPPTQPGTLYNVSQIPQLYFEVFNYWQRGFLNYHFKDNSCEPGKSCVEFKTMMNEQVNSFACSQFTCPTFKGQPKPLFAYYVTICKFDKPMPSSRPYTPSGYFVQGCNKTSCNHWPSKNQCYNNFICCTPSPVTAASTTVVPTKQNLSLVQFVAPTVEHIDPDEIVIEMNYLRQFAEPPAKRITCLDWNSDFESEIKAMPSCNAPTDPGTIYNVHEIPQTYLDVFFFWQRGYSYYHFTDNTCEPGRSCNEFKTMMNEKVNSFACVQFVCPKFTGLPDPPLAYYVTVCKFDKKSPSRLPYTPSGYYVQGCNETSCNWPSKTKCYNNFICCTPGNSKTTTLQQSTTVAVDIQQSTTTIKPITCEASDAVEDIVTEMNFHRQFAEPPAKRITCLEWDEKLKQDIELMPRCKPPTDSATLYSVLENPQTYLDVFTLWQRGYSYYHFSDNTCEPGRSCKEFKTMMNEQVNFFACSQFVCPKFDSLANPSIAYYVTICKFDKPTPTRVPYKPSGYYVQGCNATSCNWPTKTQCYNNFICCGPEPKTTTLLTTVAPSNGTTSTEARTTTTTTLQPITNTNPVTTESSTVVTPPTTSPTVNVPSLQITCLAYDSWYASVLQTMSISCYTQSDPSSRRLSRRNSYSDNDHEFSNENRIEEHHNWDGQSCKSMCHQLKSVTLMNERSTMFSCPNPSCQNVINWKLIWKAKVTNSYFQLKNNTFEMELDRVL